MAISCDVLVVGAGPAGSSAARAAAMSGAKTIFIDKKGEVGIPVQCAEGIGKYLFPYLPFKIPKNQLKWRIDGMLFWIDGVTIERKGEFWEGYTIDREEFDKWLAKRAVDVGAELWIDCELIGVELDNKGDITKAIVRRSDTEVGIETKVVIGADGTESTVLKLLGLFNPSEGDIGEIYSWEMKGLNNTNPCIEQIFVGNFTPGGYAYIFPKSRSTANVGVGGLLPKKNMEKYFDEFLEVPYVKKQIENAEFVVEKSKSSIWSDIVDKWVHNNVILAGDAANHSLKPFVEGVLPAIICGNLAGDLATRYSHLGEGTASMYVKHIENISQLDYHKSKMYMEVVKNLFKSEIPSKHLLFGGILADLFELERIELLQEMDYEHLLSTLLELKDGM